MSITRRMVNVVLIVSLTLAVFPSPSLAAVSSPAFWANWFFIHPEIKANPGAVITAVWANKAHLDLFMTSNDGTVWSAWWEAAPGWQPWFMIHPEIKADPGAPVTAVWANPSHLDLFMTSSDGKVWSTWWEAGKDWQSWFSIHPETAAAPGARVTAVWANSSHLDLFMTGGDGTVFSTWWEPVHGWQPGFSIHPETKAAPGAQITAVWANSSHIDLFMTGPDGTVYTTWWETLANWQPWNSIYPATKAAPAASVTAVWANSTHLDLFMTGGDGTVWSTWFEAQYSYQPWFSIHPETKAAPGALVTAIWSTPDHLDLFATAGDGVINTTWWELAPGWQPWGGIHPENHAAHGTPVTGLWSNPNHLDLFFTSPDGTVTSTYFDLAGSPNWGLLANPGFDGSLVKTVYFFAGDWNHGSVLPPFYENITPPQNDFLYTVHPYDPKHLGWSESVANQQFAVDAMVNAGTNVVTMSYWGEPGTDRWVYYAPMQTATGAHDELFNAALGRNILIMPAIESADPAICKGGHSPAFQFASDFPGSLNNPSPALVAQVEDLVTRYITAPANPSWPAKWAQIYDRNGIKRYAINLLHVASNQIGSKDDRTFASGFDWVANRVFQDKHVQVGFTLDLLPSVTTVKNDCSANTVRDTYTATGANTGPFLRLSSSVLAVQDFLPEIYANTSLQSYLAVKKWSYQQEWKAAGIPVYLDVDPGYDAHLVFSGAPVWGNNVGWRQALSDQRDSNIKGISFNTWNGYTEGTAAVRTLPQEYGDAAYQWLTELFGGKMPTIVLQTHPTYVQPGQNALLHVNATGDAPLNYQWYEGYTGQTGAPLSTPGLMTNTFTTPPVNQTLHYWVRTSNLAGSVDSPTYTVSAYDPSLYIYLPLTLK